MHAQHFVVGEMHSETDGLSSHLEHIKLKSADKCCAAGRKALRSGTFLKKCVPLEFSFFFRVLSPLSSTRSN